LNVGTCNSFITLGKVTLYLHLHNPNPISGSEGASFFPSLGDVSEKCDFMKSVEGLATITFKTVSTTLMKSSEYLQTQNDFQTDTYVEYLA